MSKPLFIIRIPLSADREAVSKQMDMLEKKLMKDYYLIPEIFLAVFNQTFSPICSTCVGSD